MNFFEPLNYDIRILKCHIKRFVHKKKLNFIQVAILSFREKENIFGDFPVVEHMKIIFGKDKKYFSSSISNRSNFSLKLNRANRINQNFINLKKYLI